MPSSLNLLVGLLATLGPLARADDRVCYFPDGTVSTDDVPCAGSGNTHCCARGTGVCLDNGYCLNYEQPYGLSRGSCTDRSWGSSCASHCTGSNHSPSTSARVARWKQNATDDAPWMYCCGGADQNSDYGSSACADGELPFALPDAGLLFGYAGLADAEVVISSSSSSAASTIISRDSTSPNTTTSDTAAAPSSTADTGPSAAVVGAAVGVPLGTIALLALGWGFWERRKRRALEDASASATNAAIARATTSHGEDARARTRGNSDGSDSDSVRRLVFGAAADTTAAAAADADEEAAAGGYRHWDADNLVIPRPAMVVDMSSLGGYDMNAGGGFSYAPPYAMSDRADSRLGGGAAAEIPDRAPVTEPAAGERRRTLYLGRRISSIPQ